MERTKQEIENVLNKDFNYEEKYDYAIVKIVLNLEHRYNYMCIRCFDTYEKVIRIAKLILADWKIEKGNGTLSEEEIGFEQCYTDRWVDENEEILKEIY